MLVQYVDVVVPLHLHEVERGWLWAVAMTTLEARNFSAEEPSVTVHENFTLADNATQYTRKSYDFSDRLPGWISRLVPHRLQAVEEEAWNCFPHCRTVVTHASYPEEVFSIEIKTSHLLPESAGENHPSHVFFLGRAQGGGGVCVRKIIKIRVHRWGPLGAAIEKFIARKQVDALHRVYRTMVERRAEWLPLTMAEVRDLEGRVAVEQN